MKQKCKHEGFIDSDDVYEGDVAEDMQKGLEITITGFCGECDKFVSRTYRPMMAVKEA